MDDSIEKSLEDLYEWCRQRDFAGYDPFDALNSRVFQSTPLSHSPTARLLWTQALKRSPFSLHTFARVPAQKNSKGIALFALGSLATYRRRGASEAESGARELLNELWRMRLEDFSGAAWGYNFPWQSRKFFAPQGTPTIVPTAFAARAFIEAYETFGDETYLQMARSSCDFILRDLKRSVETPEEICFSYSPLDDTRIFNASLLAAETLACVGKLTGEAEFCDIALRAARYVIARQNQDGSWFYGDGSGQEWIDNFHTAYVMVSLSRIKEACNVADVDLAASLKRGYEFWRRRFFLADGWRNTTMTAFIQRMRMPRLRQSSPCSSCVNLMTTTR